MGMQMMAMPDGRRDNIRTTLLASIILHVVLFIVVVTYTMFHFRLGPGDNTWGAKDATHVGAVTSLPGIPLPSPMVTTQTQVVTQNTGVTQTEPPPKEEVPPEATKLPKFKDEVKPEKLERINKRIHKEEYVPPPDTVDYGLRGAPSINYTQVVTAAGTGGVAMGDGNSFGLRYAWYVAAMRNRISGNWLMNTVSPNIQTAPRTNMTFAINRDGSISDVQITRSSGIPEVDRSALRAVLASTPLPPLPADYRGGSVNVMFYFDFHRQ
jgi:periplasmic protein TonB